ncbi:MAG: hypothetical protein ACRCZF_27425, partial [Gemmataceae bacterium]
MEKVLLYSKITEFSAGHSPTFYVPIVVAVTDRNGEPFDKTTHKEIYVIFDTGYNGQLMTSFKQLLPMGITQHTLWNKIAVYTGNKPAKDKPNQKLTPVLNAEGRPRVDRIETANGTAESRPHFAYVHLVCHDSTGKKWLYCLNQSNSQIDIRRDFDVSLLGTKTFASALL